MTRAGWHRPAQSLRLPLVAVLAGLALTAVGPLVRVEGLVQESATAPAHQQVEAAVRSHLYHWSPLGDPLITIENGVQVKSSNVNGIEIAGERYFYRPLYGYSADPVSRARPGGYQLVLVMDAGTEFETEIYRLTR